MNRVIASSGYPVPALTESGSLPTGLAFTDTGNGTAAIAGTPSAESIGHYTITVTTANGLGTASHTITLKARQ
jgi:hypothetical protein